MKTGDVIHGFRIEKCRELAELSALLWEMTHERTGARLAWLDRKEENKAAAITFMTIPEDDTGVFHVLEHCLLCGSEKYPVKEPVAELMKSSLQTYLNGVTYADKTVFPLASRNHADFLGLLDVYLDAVFHPLIKTHPEIFLQEGWRIEEGGIGKEQGCPCETVGSGPGQASLQGVVMSEMKGCLADPAVRLENEIYRHLFAGSCYQYVSGGDPAIIPQLTYEKLLTQYDKYYHPANARISLVGSLNLTEVLSHIDAALEGFDRRECDFEVDLNLDLNLDLEFEAGLDLDLGLDLGLGSDLESGLGSGLDSGLGSDSDSGLDSDSDSDVESESEGEAAGQMPVSSSCHHAFYPVSEDSSLEKRTILSGASLLAMHDDRVRLGMATILCEYLSGDGEAPLKRAILDRGLAGDFFMAAHEGLKQSWISWEAWRAEEENLEKIRETIDQVVSEILEAGLDRARLLAIYRRFAFRLHDNNNGITPRSVVEAVDMLEDWLYGGDPAAGILIDDVLEAICRRLDSSYPEELMRELWLKNPHEMTFVLKPSRTLAEEEREAEEERIEAWRRAMAQSAEKKAEYELWMSALRKRQEGADSEEALRTIPRLGLEELGEIGAGEICCKESLLKFEDDVSCFGTALRLEDDNPSNGSAQKLEGSALCRGSAQKLEGSALCRGSAQKLEGSALCRGSAQKPEGAAPRSGCTQKPEGAAPRSGCTLKPGAEAAASNREIPLLIHELSGNLIYFRAHFDAGDISAQELFLLSLAGNLLGAFGTKKRSRGEMTRRIREVTGRIGFWPTITAGDDIAHCRVLLSASVTALEETIDQAIDLLREILTKTIWQDTDYLRELLTQMIISDQANMIAEGHRYAAMRMNSHLTAQGFAREITGGSSYMAYIRELAEADDDELLDVLKELGDLIRRIVSLDRLSLSVSHQVSEDAMRSFARGLPSNPLESGRAEGPSKANAPIERASKAKAPIERASKAKASIEGPSKANAPIDGASKAKASIEGPSKANAPIDGASKADETIDGTSQADNSIEGQSQMNGQNYGLTQAEYSIDGPTQEILRINSPVGHAAMGGNLRAFGQEFSGQWLLLSHLISMAYLWGEIRGRGGAYGCGAECTEEGDILFYTYRDPDPEASLDAFDQIPEFLEEYLAGEPDLTGFILSAVSGLFPYRGEEDTIYGAEERWFRGVSPEQVGQWYQELIRTRPEDLRHLIPVIEDLLGEAGICLARRE